MLMVVADISASESAKRVYLIAGFLVALGVALLVVTIWFWRTTRPEHGSLAPLEVMGDRGFDKLDPQARQRKLDQVRSASGAVAPVPASQIDLGAAAREAPVGFDDLRDEVTANAPTDAHADTDADAPGSVEVAHDEVDDLDPPAISLEDDTVVTGEPSPADPRMAQAGLDGAGDRG